MMSFLKSETSSARNRRASFDYAWLAALSPSVFRSRRFLVDLSAQRGPRHRDLSRPHQAGAVTHFHAIFPRFKSEACLGRRLRPALAAGDVLGLHQPIIVEYPHPAADHAVLAANRKRQRR